MRQCCLKSLENDSQVLTNPLRHLRIDKLLRFFNSRQIRLSGVTSKFKDRPEFRVVDDLLIHYSELKPESGQLPIVQVMHCICLRPCIVISLFLSTPSCLDPNGSVLYGFGIMKTLLFLAVLASAPQAQPTSSLSELARLCVSPVSSIESYCIGYLAGFRDVLALSPAPGVCLPEGLILDQVIRTVVFYAEHHPERLHLPRHSEALNALREAFPCDNLPDRFRLRPDDP